MDRMVKDGLMKICVPFLGLLLTAASASLAGESFLAVSPVSAENPERRLPSGELLSDHVAEAEFTGVIHRKCLFRTALCPDKCDHPKDFAVFRIIKYLDYRKPGKYGDEKQESLMVDMNPAHRPILQGADILKKIAVLKPGEKVVLHWSHYYMHRDSSSFPERPVISLEPSAPSGGKAKD